MGDDRNAGGLEKTVQRLNRVLFCRSFHSKLSPVGGICPRQDRRVTPIVPPKTWPRDITSQGTSGQNDIEKPALPNLMARGVKVRTISAGGRKQAT